VPRLPAAPKQFEAAEVSSRAPIRTLADFASSNRRRSGWHLSVPAHTLPAVDSGEMWIFRRREGAGVTSR
jgi:hypothetical protein